jgi:lactoylglutathione lyase
MSATQEFSYLHTMMRVGNLDRSIKFYTENLGMKELRRADVPDGKYTLVFLGYGNERDHTVLELTYNYGTEQDAQFAYHNGNSDPRGFGHLCVSVPDVKAACERFEQLGVTFQKRLTDGRMKHIAFIRDPDEYWIEILQPTSLSL